MLKPLSFTFPCPARQQERDLGCRRDGFLEDLETLSPDLVIIEVDAGDVAARMRKARCESRPDPFNAYPNDRYCVASGADRQRDGVGVGDDHVRVAVNDLTSEIGIAFGTPLAGISLDGEVLALDIAQPSQLVEKRRPSPRPCVAEVSDRARGSDDRDPVLLRALLRLHRSRRGREQQTNREITPPHSITSSAAASTAGGTVRPSAFAVFRLIISEYFVGC